MRKKSYQTKDSVNLESEIVETFMDMVLAETEANYIHVRSVDQFQN